jgi:hypothetical protein
MFITTSELCRLAIDLALEHGEHALAYARRAATCLEADGEGDRAEFWFALSILLDDIFTQRLDPERAIAIH